MSATIKNTFSVSDFIKRKDFDRLRQIDEEECYDDEGNLLSLSQQAAIITHYLSLRNQPKFAKTYARKAEQLLAAWQRVIFGAKDRSALTQGVADASELELSYLFNDVFSSPFPPRNNPKFKFIDLFAGIGGFRMAFQNLGGECVFSSEWDEQAQRTYYANYGDMPFGDITKESTKQMIPDDFDILCAGFPCQAFSLAGKRRGFAETRGTLFFDVAEILRRKQPKAFFLENVKGLAIHDKGKTLETILNTLDEVGYVVPDPQILNAMYYGVPQHRERIYIVGFRKDLGIKKEDFKYPERLENIPCWLDVREENPVPSKYYLSETYIETLRRHRARHEAAGHGFGYKIIPDDGVANAIVCGGMGRECNLVLDFRQTDLTPTTNIKGEINKEGIRKMTPREWARLQGYPDNFRIVVADASAYKQFGNSVAVPAIQATARQILSTLNIGEINTENKLSFFFFDEMEQQYSNKTSHTKGNKGEWSEVYTMFKLLGDGRLYDGDESYNKIPDSFYPILQVIREELLMLQKNEYRYEVENNLDTSSLEAKTIAIYENNKLLMNLTSDNFMAASKKLLEDIKDGEGRSFTTSAVNEAFMEKIHCRNIKRGADHKADIIVHLYDARTQRKPILAFSIKSLVGGAPTLLNTSDATLITYSVKGYTFTDEEILEINAISGNSKLKNRISAITSKGASIEYKTFDNDTFLGNLQTIDFGLPVVLAECVLAYFSAERVSSIKDISKKITPLNLLNYKGKNPEKFYIEKMVKLLVASALGMYPSVTYSGDNEANGYIVVKEDGELVCYHFYDFEMVKRHLLENTKFDTPASKKKTKKKDGTDGADQRKPYCILYRNEEGEVEIKLNFQIRWK